MKNSPFQGQNLFLSRMSRFQLTTLALSTAARPSTFNCPECPRIYKHFRSLQQHVRCQHPEKLNTLHPPARKVYQFKCDSCSQQFNKLYQLQHHKSNVHHVKQMQPYKPNRKGRTTYQCSLCESNITIDDVIPHFLSSHDISIESKNFEFQCLDDFIQWKLQVEKETNAKFCKTRGTKHSAGIETTFFVCHRSGSFSSNSKGLRHLKKQGTYKIGGLCPSRIKLIKDSEGKCVAHFITTHVGHENSILRAFWHLRSSPNSTHERIIFQMCTLRECVRVLKKIRSAARMVSISPNLGHVYHLWMELINSRVQSLLLDRVAWMNWPMYTRAFNYVTRTLLKLCVSSLVRS